MKLKSIKVLLIGYISIIFISAIILKLPFMHYGNISFVDALFTATSALTCTGLIVKNTSLDFTTYGHVFILWLIQIGGFGYMSMLGILYLIVGKRLSNSEKNLIKENMSSNTLDGIDKIILRTLVFVFIIELIGGAILSANFYHLGFSNWAWLGIFHSISAFNNAGFSLFETGLMDFRDDFITNMTICALIIIGGLGFLVSLELNSYLFNKSKKILRLKSQKIRLSLNAKIVLSVTSILIVTGVLTMLLFEFNNAKSIGNLSFYEKVLTSFFASVNYRTAGFNTIDLSTLTDPSLFFSTLFMNIGGSPGGTASGIKTITIAVLLALTYSIIKGRKDVVLFKRKIASDAVQKAFTIFTIASVFLFVATFILALFEPETKFLYVLYEVSSAFATVGVSVGDGGTLSLSATFNDAGLFVVMIMMVSGKIGILSFALIFGGSHRPQKANYVHEKILI